MNAGGAAIRGGHGGGGGPTGGTGGAGVSNSGTIKTLTNVGTIAGGNGGRGSTGGGGGAGVLNAGLDHDADQRRDNWGRRRRTRLCRRSGRRGGREFRHDHDADQHGDDQRRKRRGGPALWQAAQAARGSANSGAITTLTNQGTVRGGRGGGAGGGLPDGVGGAEDHEFRGNDTTLTNRKTGR